MTVPIVGQQIPITILAPIYDTSGYSAHARDLVLTIERSGKFKARLEPKYWSVHSYVKFSPEDKEDFDKMLGRQLNVEKEEGILMTISIPNEFQITKTTINIGVTAGIEVDRASTVWAQACNNMHGTIVSSLFSKRGLMEAGVQTPIEVVGEGVRPFDELATSAVLSELDDIETSFNFLTAGQWGEMNSPLGSDRKDLGNLILYFLQAFRGRKDVGFIAKIYGQNNSTPDWIYTKNRIRHLRTLAGGDEYPKIHLVHGTMTELELARLYHHPKVKAFVTTTHGECWGRHIAEAVAAGLPILCTGWGAHMEFLSSRHSAFFDYKLEPVPQAALWSGVIDQGTQWATCEPESVKRLMKRCVSKCALAKQKALEQRDMAFERHGWEKTMKEFVDTVQRMYWNYKSTTAGIEHL